MICPIKCLNHGIDIDSISIQHRFSLDSKK